MSRVFQPLIFLIARSTHQLLARHLEFDDAQLEMTRERVPQKNIHLRPEEKARLLKLGEAIGPGIRHLIKIVDYSTYRRWVREAQGTDQPTNKRGRPRTAAFLREIIVRIATEMGCGYTRVMGEMKKLGIKPPSRSTVKNIMKENNLDPGPKRGRGTWDEFLKIHADTLWQIDFFSKKIWTFTGLRHYFVLAFLHVGSRRVWVSKAVAKPNSAWMQRQANEFLKHAEDESIGVDIIIRDRDGKYGKEFDAILEDPGGRVTKTAVRAPNQNAFVERWVQSIKHEVLDHFNYLISEYVEHYLTERPHQGIDNELIIGRRTAELSDKPPDCKILCHERLGGVLKHYYRAAA
jgi:putative transposase